MFFGHVVYGMEISLLGIVFENYNPHSVQFGKTLAGEGGTRSFLSREKSQYPYHRNRTV